MKICYFTATGNSLYVSKRIGGELLSIPMLMRQNKIELTDDAVGIVCPVYAGEMPRMVRKFLEKANIKTEYFFFIYTYGMFETVARPNAVLAARKAGLTLHYVNAIQMVDNYLPGFEMQNQIDTAPKKKIEEHLERICKDISDRRVGTYSVSALDKIKMGVVHGTMGKAVLKGTAAQSYMVNQDCICCGICEKVCPAGNIKVADKVIFSDRCEVCYACLHNCPKHAIHLKTERSAVRFRNEHITLQELLSANNVDLDNCRNKADKS